MNAKDLRYTVRQLIGIYRQCGNTSTVVQAALNSDAYLVVADQAAKTRIIKQHPELRHRVFSISNLDIEIRGRKAAPLLFDPDAINQLCKDSPMTVTHEEIMKKHDERHWISCIENIKLQYTRNNF